MPRAPSPEGLSSRVARRVASTWFYRIAYTGMFLTGAKLLWDGLR